MRPRARSRRPGRRRRGGRGVGERLGLGDGGGGGQRGLVGMLGGWMFMGCGSLNEIVKLGEGGDFCKKQEEQCCDL